MLFDNEIYFNFLKLKEKKNYLAKQISKTTFVFVIVL